MTTGNNGDQPNPADNQQQPDPAAQGADASQQQHPEPQETDVADFDDQAVVQAQAAVDAEEAAGGAGAGTDQQPGTSQQQQPDASQRTDQQQQGGAQQRPDQQPAMIPKPRLDEALSDRDKALQQAAYWQGIAEARGQTPKQPPNAGGAAPAQPQQQQPTVETRLAEVHAKQDALALRLDNGELTMADYTKENRALAAQERAINNETLLAQVKPADNGTGNELYLDSVTAQIEQAHPWVDVYEKVGTQRDWDYIRDQAAAALIARQVDPTTPRGLVALREEAAKLMDQYGPTLLADRARAKGIKLPDGQPAQPQQQQPQQPGAVKPLSPVARLRQEKTALAANAAPNLNQMGGTPANASKLTDAAIETMSEEAFDKLPEDQVARMLNS